MINVSNKPHFVSQLLFWTSVSINVHASEEKFPYIKP